MSKIKRVFAQEVLDSRGMPTVEVRIELVNGIAAKSSAPSAFNHLAYEAKEIRDHDMKRFGGMGVLTAVKNVNEIIAPRLSGVEVTDQQKIDRMLIELDGTPDKGKLGVNSILPVSQAVAKAGAKSSLLPLPVYIRQFLPNETVKLRLRDQKNSMPVPIFCMVEGGNAISKGMAFKEFVVIPATSKSYEESLEMGVTVYYTFGTLLKELGLSVLTSYKGGYSPIFSSDRDVLVALKQSLERTVYQYSLDVFLGISIHANSFYNSLGYKIRESGARMGKEELFTFYKDLITEFSMVYVEDAFAESDWEGWGNLYSSLSSRILIAGSDLVCSNPYRLQLATEHNAINAVLLKLDQIGTVTEALAFTEIARYKNLKVIVSARSGETGDSFVSDFAVGSLSDYIKFGAPVRDRVVKYNRLLEINRELDQI